MPYTGNDGKCTVESIVYPVTSWELNESIVALDTTHMDDASPPEARDFISDGLRNATGSFVFDVTDAKRPPRPTIGDPVTFELKDKHDTYDGECLITSVGTPREVGEKVTCTVEIQVCGEVNIT